jgi:hypothetical protein
VAEGASVSMWWSGGNRERDTDEAHEAQRFYGRLKLVEVPGWQGPPLLTSEKFLRQFDDRITSAMKEWVDDWRKVLWRDAPGLPPKPSMPRLGEFVGE